MDPSTPYPVVGRSPAEKNTGYETVSGVTSLLFFTYLAINMKIIIKITKIVYNNYN
jgi:hypothetical protein